MANLIMVAPIAPATLTASRGSGAANLLTADPKEVWLDSAAGTAATIDVDLGAVVTIDTVLLGHVYGAHADARWSISGGLDGHGEFAVMADSALRAVDSPGQAPKLTNALWHGSAVNVRYLRIALTQKAGEQPVSIGCQVIGKAFMPQYNMTWGAGRKVIDTGTATPLPDGGFAVVEGVRKGAFEWTLQDLSPEETEQLYILQLICGSTKPLLVVEDPQASPGQGYRIHYCKLVNLKSYERRNPAQTRWDLSVEDWGATEASVGGVSAVATIYNTLSNSNLRGDQVVGFIAWADELDGRLTAMEAAE
ncbi:hypothetical protein D2V17_14170 [Aurantiacibacter xanthus]|uniref:F5/8 type C domain-containing protein n=1 Tax=Aurantiacibacter xanthus TaxID=1784712 RepID=A0A3A1P1Y2_9SPHN|nr:hypothetical protein [Aurantiacibacter xanthus]RIV82944.1 hypothetical protein D2V17_14170 [Aurantiacibacter xanthus]